MVSVSDALRVLQSGRELRGTIELDEALLTWRARFDGRGHIAVDLDEIGLDDPIPYELTQDGQQALHEPQPDDFPL